MNDKSYKMSKLKHQLLERKRLNKKNPCWKLNQEQREYITEVLHLEIRPVLYEIRTQSCNLVQGSNHILKDIDYKYRRGIKKKVCRLTKKDKDILDREKVKYKVLKEEILLR